MKIENIINKNNNWLFSDNHFSQYMIFNPEAYIKKKHFYENFYLFFKLLVSFIWIFFFYIYHFFCPKINIKTNNNLIFNFKETQSINKILENNNFEDSVNIVNLLSKREVLGIYRIKFKLLISNTFICLAEVIKIHMNYSYPNEVKKILLQNIDKKIANYVILCSIFNSLQKDNIKCKVYSGGAFFPSYASIKYNFETYYYTHGLLGKFYKKLYPNFKKIYVFSEEEKIFLDNLKLGICIETYTFKKIENHKRNIIIYSRGVDDSLNTPETAENFDKMLDYFISKKIKLYVKLHPYYRGNFFNSKNSKYSIIKHDKKLNTDILIKLKPILVISWYSTVIAEALYSNIIPINLVNDNDIKKKFHKVKITDWIIFPIMFKSLNWKLDKNKIDSLIDDKKNYSNTINNLLKIRNSYEP